MRTLLGAQGGEEHGGGTTHLHLQTTGGHFNTQSSGVCTFVTPRKPALRNAMQPISELHV